MEIHTFARRLQKHKTLNNHFCWIADKATEKLWDEQCAELEKHERQGNVDILYLVSQVTVTLDTNRNKKSRVYM